MEAEKEKKVLLIENSDDTFDKIKHGIKVHLEEEAYDLCNWYALNKSLLFEKIINVKVWVNL